MSKEVLENEDCISQIMKKHCEHDEMKEEHPDKNRTTM